ncbi:MAG: hypothetical protein SW833_08020 [Cyanobacteriota bacterium]|nr:hypothetical protein [Cyanobacteriota bacterium]
MNPSSLLEQAARSVTVPSSSVVEALLQAEKTARQTKVRYSFEQLVGNWRLRFVTGTKKTRSRAGVVLGAGRYIPRLITIQLSYSITAIPDAEPPIQAGRVENSVELGALKFILTGPTKWLPKRNILAFDFTRMTVQLWGKTVYRGNIRGGEGTEAEFYRQGVGKQAFFAYFWVSEDAIAARGRGGGLALWGRQV